MGGRGKDIEGMGREGERGGGGVGGGGVIPCASREAVLTLIRAGVTKPGPKEPSGRTRHTSSRPPSLVE